jgi:hypothetical protein
MGWLVVLRRGVEGVEGVGEAVVGRFGEEGGIAMEIEGVVLSVVKEEEEEVDGVKGEVEMSEVS